MNPHKVKIPKTLHLATNHAGRNVIPTTTNSFGPPFIDWNLLATSHVSRAAAISGMISVVIGVSPSKIIIQGEKEATTPSPPIYMCSALDACPTSFVDGLCEEQEDSSFEEVVRSFLSFMLRLTLESPHSKCPAPYHLSHYQIRSCAVFAEQTRTE